MILSMYFSVNEASTLIRSFLVKGSKREASIWGTVNKSIPSNKVAGLEVRTVTGFCSISETGRSS